jgi:malate permease and related proteins
MSPFVLKIIPLILSFFVGFGLKQVKLLTKDDAPILLRFVLSVSLPALTILAIYRVKLAPDMVFIPFCAMLTVLAMFGVSSFVGKRLRMPDPTYGSFLVGTLIMNTAYSLPFFKAAFGDEGLARASLFDIGNTFLIFTFTYYNAIKYGDNSHSDKVDWKKFLKLPPLYAMALAFGIKALQWKIPDVGINFFELVGQPTGPLVMIALGLTFAPKLAHLGKASIAVFIRMGVGLLVGWLLSLIFNLHDVSRTTVIVCSAMPVGFNTLIFANLENMDREFAATMVSISILIALGYIPLLIWLFK